MCLRKAISLKEFSQGFNMFNFVRIQLELLIDSVKLDKKGSEFGFGLDSMKAHQQKYLPDKKPSSNKYIQIMILICRWHIFNVKHIRLFLEIFLNNA